MTDETKTSAEDSREASPDESRVVARRYFLRAALYAAPAVASVVAVQHASAAASFCTNCSSNRLLCRVQPGCNANGCCN